MKKYKFRAWVEETRDNKFNDSYKKAKEKYESIEPSPYDDEEWDKWYEAKDLYRICLSNHWELTHSQAEKFTKTHKMIDKININGEIVQKPINCNVIDVMQYVWIDDINGKGYYEGDIFKYPHPNAGYGRIDINGYCVSIIRDIRELYEDHSTSSGCLATNMRNGEIIGDIYRNPELINIKEMD